MRVPNAILSSMATLKTLTVLLVSLGLAAVSASASVVFSSPYAGQNPGSANDQDGVIGMNGQFDVQSLAFTTISLSNVTVKIDYNYNFGDATLAPFLDSGILLGPSDLLFSSGGKMWGVALSSRTDFTAGDLYSVDGFLTAGEVLGFPSASYNPSDPVWMQSDASQELIGAGTSTTTAIGGDEVETTLSFTPGTAFYSILTSGLTDVEFGGADCANDFLTGTIPAIAVPEPGAFTLLGSGLLGLSLLPRLRRRRK
jgi:hypothetical protein